MIIVFIVVCLIIAFLVFLMFLILKKTVSIVNDQTKSYFVNKLQGYDDLIQGKEAKLQEIDDLIKDREKGINKEEIQGNNNTNYAFDTNILNIMNSTKYQDQNIFELNKKIDEKHLLAMAFDMITFGEMDEHDKKLFNDSFKMPDLFVLILKGK